MIKTLSPKDPNDVVIVKVDFTRKLRTNAVTVVNTVSTFASIVSANVTATPADNTTINVTNTNVNGNVVSYVVSGGSANSVYKITTQVTLSDNQIWNRSVKIPVQEM